MRELLIGSGHDKTKRISAPGETWKNLVTLDVNPRCKPDVVYDLNGLLLPFKDSTFDEIHAYEVMEHLGKQGDWPFFFTQFDDFARVLKPSGTFYMSSPHAESKWLWGDPGHTRYVGPECLVFLNRDEYRRQLGNTMMTDYRDYFLSDWRIIYYERHEHSNYIGLQSVGKRG